MCLKMTKQLHMSKRKVLSASLYMHDRSCFRKITELFASVYVIAPGSAVALLVGLWVLLAPRGVGEAPFAATAPALTALLAAWLVAAYCAAAAAPVQSLPSLARSLGLYGMPAGGSGGGGGIGADTAQPLSPLLGLLAVTIALAGLTRSRRLPVLPDR